MYLLGVFFQLLLLSRKTECWKIRFLGLPRKNMILRKQYDANKDNSVKFVQN